MSESILLTVNGEDSHFVQRVVTPEYVLTETGFTPTEHFELVRDPDGPVMPKGVEFEVNANDSYLARYVGPAYIA